MKSFPLCTIQGTRTVKVTLSLSILSTVQGEMHERLRCMVGRLGRLCKAKSWVAVQWTSDSR